MRLFLDTSVLLAASGSATGASRELFRRANDNDWVLIATPYVIEEVLRNLQYLPATGSMDWVGLRPALLILDDILTLDRPAVFGPRKDRPILYGALAWADLLLTLDRGDFGGDDGQAVLWTARINAWGVSSTGTKSSSSKMKSRHPSD